MYLKEETHYFVMTAKKESLLKFGVLKEDIPDDEGPGGGGTAINHFESFHRRCCFIKRENL